MVTHKLAVCACLLLFGGILSLGEESPAKPVDPKTIGKAYRASATNADLLYKGKVLAVAGVVTAITNDHAGGGVGRVYFASQSEVKRLGELSSSVEPDRKPHAIYQPDPAYTRQAEKARLQGIVELSLLVGADGHPSDVRITRSLGMGLDESSIATVETWRFEPALRNGTPIPMRVTVEVTFKLYP
jgi:TonB family protein